MFILFVVDLLHKFELGMWKAIFTHLLHILYAQGGNVIQILNKWWVIILRNFNGLTPWRYQAVSTFGCGTIWWFHKNASAMKRLAGWDFEDLLCCTICIQKYMPSPTDISLQSLSCYKASEGIIWPHLLVDQHQRWWFGQEGQFFRPSVISYIYNKGTYIRTLSPIWRTISLHNFMALTTQAMNMPSQMLSESWLFLLTTRYMNTASFKYTTWHTTSGERKTVSILKLVLIWWCSHTKMMMNVTLIGMLILFTYSMLTSGIMVKRMHQWHQSAWMSCLYAGLDKTWILMGGSQANACITLVSSLTTLTRTLAALGSLILTKLFVGCI